jgi:hypothetical protein
MERSAVLRKLIDVSDQRTISNFSAEDYAEEVPACCSLVGFLSLLFNHEDEGSMFLRNAGNLLPD